MLDFAIFWEWLAFAVRWLHVITAIAWIGSSFYFVALDLGLRQAPNLPEGAHGEEWQVHGGGFYHIRKYLVAPAEMPDHLTWFKWESYGTWISGFLMLCVVYYAGANLFLIDKNVLDISPLQGIGISVASIFIGWFLYDQLCKSPLGENTWVLLLLLYGFMIFMAWGYTHLFTGRAAMLHLGVITATIMSANVFVVIIPNQKIVVADLIAGKKPDPKYGKIAKQRSLHNNYLTLPVLFFMLSNHYPLAFGTQFNWVIASLVFPIGALIRHYFNSVHARKGNPHWTWLAATILFIIIIWLSSTPKILTGEPTVSDAGMKLTKVAEFAAARDVVMGRCSMCHAADPVWEGVHFAPKGVMLETDAQIASHAHEIYLQAGRSHAMPPANLSEITDAERQTLVAWYDAATKATQ
jgi:uncharacterized membrane protein